MSKKGLKLSDFKKKKSIKGKSGPTKVGKKGFQSEEAVSALLSNFLPSDERESPVVGSSSQVNQPPQKFQTKKNQALQPLSPTHKALQETEAISGDPVKSGDTQAVSGDQVKTGDTQVVSDDPVKSGDTQVVSGDQVKTGDTQVVSDDPVKSGDTQVVSGDLVKTGDTQAVSGDPVKTDDTQVVSGDPVKTGDTQAVSGDPVKTDDTQAVSGDQVKTGDTQVVSDDPVKSGDTQVVSGDPVKSDNLILEKLEHRGEAGPKEDEEILRFARGYSKVPHALCDYLISCQLSKSQFAAFLVIIRETVGWGKNEVHLPKSKIGRLTKIHMNSLRGPLNGLIDQHNLISYKVNAKKGIFSLNWSRLGFSSLDDALSFGYSKVPNLFIYKCLALKLNTKELRFIFNIIRNSIGWRKTWAEISNPEMAKQTNIGIGHVSLTKKSLEKDHRLISSSYSNIENKTKYRILVQQDTKVKTGDTQVVSGDLVKTGDTVNPGSVTPVKTGNGHIVKTGDVDTVDSGEGIGQESLDSKRIQGDLKNIKNIKEKKESLSEYPIIENYFSSLPKKKKEREVSSFKNLINDRYSMKMISECLEWLSLNGDPKKGERVHTPMKWLEMGINDVLERIPRHQFEREKTFEMLADPSLKNDVEYMRALERIKKALGFEAAKQKIAELRDMELNRDFDLSITEAERRGVINHFRN